MTQVCADCGAPTSVDEDFCGECGAYLEWDERAATPEPVPEPVATPAPEAAPPKLSLIRRVVAPLTDAGDRPPATVPPVAPTLPPQAPTGTPPMPGRPPAGPPPAGPPAAGPPPAPVSRPAGPPQPRIPVTAPQPGHPAPVQPGVAAPRPTRRPERDTDQPLQPGDVICGQCGAGNKPTRKFCRRCGHDLTDAPVAKIPWWRRLFARRPKTGPEAGTRPRMRRGGRPRRSPRQLLTLLTVVAIVLGGGYFARGYVRGAADIVIDRVKGTEPVNPTGLEASSSQPGHGPGRARDGKIDRYWAPASGGAGKGEHLVATFDEPFRLVYVVVTPGVHGKDEEAYLDSFRPKEIRVVITSEDGSTRVKTIELNDGVGADQFNVTGSNVTKVKLEIMSSYRGKVAGSHTAIAEVEFHARK